MKKYITTGTYKLKMQKHRVDLLKKKTKRAKFEKRRNIWKNNVSNKIKKEIQLEHLKSNKEFMQKFEQFQQQPQPEMEIIKEQQND